MNLNKDWAINRRNFLGGTLSCGVKVAVGLPLLDYFLNDSGTAYANGVALPVRFGTWFWGLGMDVNVFVPKKVGADYDLPPQIASFAPVSKHVNIFSNYNVLTDGKPNLCHYTGWVALQSGVAPSDRGNLPDPSIDVLVADAIGNASRFRSLSAAATGSLKDTYSYRSGDSMNPPLISPMELYKAIFGPDFTDPNSPEFKPSTAIMTRHSVLSAVGEQRTALMRTVGANDRAKLDQYFTSLRDLERGLEAQMQKPPPAPSCKRPAPPEQKEYLGINADVVAERHRLMSDLMAMALACNQTRVFNMTYSNSGTGLTREGLDKSHHSITHEESVKAELGYQPTSHWFICEAMASFAYFVKALASMPEGDGSVLDNSVVYAHSDHELARTHSISGIPMMSAGRAGGRLKTGIHVDGGGESPTRLGLTLMQAMGMNAEEWGKGSLKVGRTINEIVV